MMYIIKPNHKLFYYNTFFQIYNDLKIYKFYFFIDYYYLTNNNLLNLKLEIIKLNNKSFILNSKYVKKLFTSKIGTFIGVKTLVICITNLDNFINILQYLHLIPFYFSYERNFSNIINSKFLFNIKNNQLNIILFINFILFKLIMNIIVLLLYLLYTFIKCFFS